MSDNTSSLSIEETNKVRVKLGLKPLSTQSTSRDTSSTIKTANTARTSTTTTTKEAVDTVKNTNTVKHTTNNRKQSSRTLSLFQDDDGDDFYGSGGGEDTKAWLARVPIPKPSASTSTNSTNSKKHIPKDTSDLDKSSKREYTSADLRGMRVNHAADSLNMGKDTILVLRDSIIPSHIKDEIDNDPDGFEEGDMDGIDGELVNPHLEESEKITRLSVLKRHLNRTKGKHTNLDHVSIDGLQGMDGGVLMHYDLDLLNQPSHNGPQSETLERNSGFVIGTNGQMSASEIANKHAQQRRAIVDSRQLQIHDGSKQRGDSVDLNSDTFRVGGDYLLPSSTSTANSNVRSDRDAKGVSFKPNKRKARQVIIRKRPISEIISSFDNNDMGTTQTANGNGHNGGSGDGNLVDDLDLQDALAASRRLRLRLATREENKTNPIDLLSEIKNSEMAVDGPGELSNEHDERGNGNTRLVISETTEFVNAVRAGISDSIKVVKPSLPTPSVNASEDKIEMESKMEVDSPPSTEPAATSKSATTDETLKDPTHPIAPSSILSQDHTAASDLRTDKGIASTLKLLKQQGAIKRKTEDDWDRETQLRERERWLLKRQQLEASNQTHQEGERDMMDFTDSRGNHSNIKTGVNSTKNNNPNPSTEVEDRFREYRPQLNLDHVDEHGRILDQKEAWKQLCHRFHGRLPGKQQTEKRLKKIAMELARERMEAGDGGGVEAVARIGAEAMHNLQQGAGAAHLVLGVGRKNAIPMPKLDTFRKVASSQIDAVETKDAVSDVKAKSTGIPFLPPQLTIKRQTLSITPSPLKIKQVATAQVGQANPLPPPPPPPISIPKRTIVNIQEKPKSIASGFKLITASTPATAAAAPTTKAQEPTTKPTRTKIQFGLASQLQKNKK